MVDAELVEVMNRIADGERVDARELIDDVAAIEAQSGIQVAGYQQRTRYTHMYRPIEKDGHGDRRPVPIGNVPMLRRCGWTSNCPFCGQRNCEQKLNECPGQEPKLYAVCDTCGKVIADDIEGSYLEPEDGPEDPYRIMLTERTTPQMRIEARMAIHYRTKHPVAAMAKGYARADGGPGMGTWQPTPPVTPTKRGRAAAPMVPEQFVVPAADRIPLGSLEEE
jgi:hypothetical protein